jgi:hypothetical protein
MPTPAKVFATKISIKATPEKIWGILTDAPAWPSWNTTITKVDGSIALGNKVTLYTKKTAGRAFPVKVAQFEAPKRMVWSGGMPLGLFKGERVYELTPKGGEIEFFMREEYTGLMAPMIVKSIPDLQPDFEEFAQCLKARAEGK